MFYEEKLKLHRSDMSQMRKKSFSFEEEELSWINPLLVEWAKENEGKNQSGLILQLLEEYKDRTPTLKETLNNTTSTMKEKLTDYSSKSRESLDGLLGKSKVSKRLVHTPRIVDPTGSQSTRNLVGRGRDVNCPVARLGHSSERTFRCNRHVTMDARSLSSLSSTNSESLSKPASLQKRNRYDTSPSEPTAMLRCRANSRRPNNEAPSAIFVGAERAARRIWLVRPNRSSLGKPLVMLWTDSANP